MKVVNRLVLCHFNILTTVRLIHLMSIMLFCSVFDRFWQLNYAARMNLVNFKSTTVIDVIDRPWKSRLWTALGRPKAPAAGAEARRNF